MSFRPTRLEVIDEVRMPPDVDAKVRQLLCACFPPDVPIFSITRHWHGSAPAFSVVIHADDVVVGNVAIVIRTIRAGTATVTVAGIQNMAIRREFRGAGLGAPMLEAAMREAVRREVQFGLLFCVPGLERYYAQFGWTRRDVDTRMDYDRQQNIPIPGKNICMVNTLGDEPFPEGDLHLQGPDW
ncbi:MAG: hypothetical protein A3K19_17845 [Lentisphaerae bacterium RIFOXYB12_FULL_65_16]|nr:MAG: hypothetical protein A3K18_16170 [Lentisphaerae bacterium RIFOXYA12_64_32]OGV85312.1 MAG: hypothetical protein A3K19_17845 [Lentisphaerae bacterium RIFOXYB12_FULL_65_16]